jgi:small-conductance mechanosensitive channel
MLLLAMLLAAVPGAGIMAQTPAPAPIPAAAPTSQKPAVAPKPAATRQPVGPAQAQQALDLLRDDKRRSELIATLDAIVKLGAAPEASAAVVAAEPPPAAAAVVNALPLEPDSLVGQAVTQVSTAISNAGSQFVTSLQSVNDLPLLWRWARSQASDPDARARIIDAAWKLAVVMAAALAAEWAGRAVLRRMRHAVARATPEAHPQAPSPDAPPEGPEHIAAAAETAQSARARRLNMALASVKRLPYLLGRLLLDLAPIVLFGLVANLLLGTWLGDAAPTRRTIRTVVYAYLAIRLLLAVTAMLVSPVSPQQRLLPISHWMAEFLSRWTRRIGIIGISGYALADVGLQFSMYRTAYDALLKLFSFFIHACLVVAVLQAREPVARRIRARPGAGGIWPTLLNRLADTWHLVAIFYIVALWLVWAVELRNGYIRLVHFFVDTAGVLIAARLVAVVLLGGLDRTKLLPGLASRYPGMESRAHLYHPVLRAAVQTLVGVATVLGLLEVWGFDVLGWLSVTGLGGRTLSALTLIGVTVLVSVLIWEGANTGIELHLRKLSHSAQMARAGRLRTLLPMLRTVLLATIVIIVSLMVLSELGVNIAPLLAGAGVVGIAVGFGSQKLVQDLITGLFLLLENAMQVGDVVTLGGLSGTVEALSIRTIRLRAVDGSVHIIPFSAVTTVTNQTRDYGYAVLDVSVGLNEESDRIAAVLKEVADAMRKEPRWQAVVLEPLDVMGVERFVDLAWIMRVRMKTQPSSRWAVARELNRRIKARFDELAIESPFTSHRILGVDPPPPLAPIRGAPEPTA